MCVHCDKTVCFIKECQITEHSVIPGTSVSQALSSTGNFIYEQLINIVQHKHALLFLLNSARQIQTYVTVLAVCLTVCKQSYLVYILGLAVRKLFLSLQKHSERLSIERENIFRYVNQLTSTKRV